MAKIAHPVAHELGITRRKLDDANQQLAAARAEIALLSDEVTRLRQHVPPKFREGLPLFSSTSADSEDKKTETSIARYARSTQASQHRSAKLTTQTQHPTTALATITLRVRPVNRGWNDDLDCTRAPFPSIYRYRDGSLVKDPTGYLQATKSSAARLCPKISRRIVECEVIPKETQPEARPGSWWGNRSTASVLDDDDSTTYEQDRFRRPRSFWWLYRMDTSPRKLSDTEYKDVMDLFALLPATRLEDNILKETPLKHMLIDDVKQARLLIRGRELAQRCFWKFAEKQMPGQNPWIGWQQVRLEWGLLSESWGDGSRYHRYLRFRASRPYFVWSTISDVISIRHTTSHYSGSSGLFPFSLADVDEHLKNVQKMAIHFYDKQGALEARSLRDELRQAAQHTFEEILALGMLVALPFAGYPWKDHHEHVFRRLLRNAEDADQGRSRLDAHFPEAIGRIAQDWSGQHPRRKGEKYEPPVSLGACPRTPPKRRHSTSSCGCAENLADLVARIRADRDWQRRNGCEDPYNVPERFLETHGQASPEGLPRARRRLSYSG